MDGSLETNSPKLLIVDDNPLITTVVKDLLEPAGYRVFTCHEGDKALDLIQKEEVEVIISDVMMPTMDGYTLHQKLRECPKFAHIPFIFMSGLSDKSEINKGHSSGADEYLTKPFDPESLLSVIRGKIVRSRTLRKLNEERDGQYRKKVVQTLSHEFRTPLVAINTGTELLLQHEGSLPPDKTKQLLESIYRGGQRLERLVTNFMLVQQIEAGIAERMFATRAEKFDLNTAVENIVEQSEAEQLWPGRKLEYTCSKKELFCLAYYPQIMDVLRRLVDNGFKFSELNCAVMLESGEEADSVWIKVYDMGRGFDYKAVNSSKAAFEQFDREKFEQQGGGLGLCIASSYVEIHGGTLLYSAGYSGGTVAKMTLPKYLPRK